ncbi:MAG: EamA family transporter [Candidatus Omnitrophica bacterium]|nr:EamA family transporter [Candidatus Omnitrophota bacterium]
MNNPLLLVIIAELLTTSGQIFFKKSADTLNADNASGKPWVIKLMAGVLRNPFIWLGGTLMLLGLSCWFRALSLGDLNYVYLLGSIQYIFTLIAAHYFLHEKITSSKLIGTLLISLGIILTSIK